MRRMEGGSAYPAQEIQEKSDLLHTIEKTFQEFDAEELSQVLAPELENPELATQFVQAALHVVEQQNPEDSVVFTTFMNDMGLKEIPKTPEKRQRFLIALLLLILTEIIGVGCASPHDYFTMDKQDKREKTSAASVAEAEHVGRKIWESWQNESIPISMETTKVRDIRAEWTKISSFPEEMKEMWIVLGVSPDKAILARGHRPFTPDVFLPWQPYIPDMNEAIVALDAVLPSIPPQTIDGVYVSPEKSLLQFVEKLAHLGIPWEKTKNYLFYYTETIKFLDTLNTAGVNADLIRQFFTKATGSLIGILQRDWDSYATSLKETLTPNELGALFVGFVNGTSSYDTYTIDAKFPETLKQLKAKNEHTPLGTLIAVTKLLLENKETTIPTIPSSVNIKMFNALKGIPAPFETRLQTIPQIEELGISSEFLSVFLATKTDQTLPTILASLKKYQELIHVFQNLSFPTIYRGDSLERYTMALHQILFENILSEKETFLIQQLQLGPQESLWLMDWMKTFDIPADKALAYGLKAKEQLNMKNFFRLDPEVLDSLLKGPALEDLEKQKDDIGILILPRTDWNGAFQGEAPRKLYRETLASMHGRGFCFEVETEDQLFNIVKNVGTRFGKISLLIISGHGSQDSISLGDVDPRLHKLTGSEEMSLSKEDEEDIKKFGLKDVLRPDALVILQSCSTAAGGETAENIAGLLHKTLEARLIGATEPIPLKQYLVEYGPTGRITSCTVNVSGEVKSVEFKK